MCVHICGYVYKLCTCVYKCVSMCVHVHVCVHCVHVCGQAHMYKYGGWSLMLGVFLALSLSFSSETGSASGPASSPIQLAWLVCKP